MVELGALGMVIDSGDAEDTVQETFMRIAGSVCLDLPAKRRPEPATGGAVPWLKP